MSTDTVGYWCGEGAGHRCGYCSNESSSISTGLYLSFTTAHRYNALIDRGWRRSGQYMYKPSMQKTCCPQYTIRCDALNFKLSRSQKRALKSFEEYLEKSKPGSLPVKRRACQKTNEVQHEGYQQDTPTVKEPMCVRALQVSAVQVSGPSCNGASPNTDSSSVPNSSAVSAVSNSSITPVSRAYKTGAQLAESRKKRDFRRLRKLKKIAEKKGVSWETEVFELVTLQQPISLTERLSKAASNARLELKLVRIEPDIADSPYQQTFSESHKLFQKYQTTIHNDNMDECDERHFTRFLCNPPFQDGSGSNYGGFHHQYYLDGKLVAVGVLDLLPWCISSVYFYYDPDFNNLSLGSLSALFEVKLTQDMNTKFPELKWYYMGYYIHTCQKMRYKSNFAPSFLLCPKRYTWWPVEECKKQLDAQKYCEFDEQEGGLAEVSDGDLDSLKVLYERRLCQYSVYKTLCGEEDDYSDVLRLLVQLTGMENAKNICVYT